MPVRSLDHVQLAMPAGGEEEARTFYSGILGLPETPKPPHLAKRGGCWFERPPLRVHLGVDSNFIAARKAHLAFIVTGLAQLIVKLEESQRPVVQDEPLEGFDRIYTEDPFGNRIELMEPR